MKTINENNRIIMNTKNAKMRFKECDWDKLYNGAVLDSNVLNSCKGVTVIESTELIIDDSFDGNYGVINDDGSIEIMEW